MGREEVRGEGRGGERKRREGEERGRRGKGRGRERKGGRGKRRKLTTAKFKRTGCFTRSLSY